MAQVDLVVLVERGRQVVLFDLSLALAGVLRVRLIAEVEALIDGQCKRLQTAAARQLERRLDVADQPELLLVLENVERQRNRFDDAELLLLPQLPGGVDLLEPLLRCADLVEIQRENEPLNIPWKAVWRLAADRPRSIGGPRLGDEQLFVEADGVPIGHAGDEVARGAVDSFGVDDSQVEELVWVLPHLLP